MSFHLAILHLGILCEEITGQCTKTKIKEKSLLYSSQQWKLVAPCALQKIFI